MKYWIFDLDNTLYQGELNHYRQLRNAKKLFALIKNLPGKKVLFTNGNGYHAKMCIKAMKLENLFEYIIHRDLIQDLKPSLSSYQKMINICNIKLEDQCIFFEDTAINLIKSKKFKWITVFISPYTINNKNVDYSFSNVYIALAYFYRLMNNIK